MLIDKVENTHYYFIKGMSALLHDQSKHRDKKHFCEICLTGFTRADILARHSEHWNRINGRPTKIEMPKEGKTS